MTFFFCFSLLEPVKLFSGSTKMEIFTGKRYHAGKKLEKMTLRGEKFGKGDFARPENFPVTPLLVDRFLKYPAFSTLFQILNNLG